MPVLPKVCSIGERVLLSQVRLSDVWYAYGEKFRTMDEMLESKAGGDEGVVSSEAEA